MEKKDIVYAIYSDSRTVFRINDVAMLVEDSNLQSISKKLNYYVHTGRLLNPRKGLYAKSGYNPEEIACILYTPAYISLEYVLQRSGIVFQYDSRITAVSYLNREVEVTNQIFSYRKMKGELLVNTMGILRQDNHVNIATPERAFLDMLYLSKEYYFDNLKPLDQKLINKILPTFQSKALTIRVKNIFQNV